MGGIYRYDGTFEGLLTLMARLITNRILPDDIVVKPPSQQNLFDGITTVETDCELAEAFLGELTKRLPPACLGHVQRAFLADLPGRELTIFRYLRLAREVGKKIGGMLAHPHVEPIWKLSRQVGIEAHRYKGFVRFQETAGSIYYSAISPCHRIVPLIAPHFASRFGVQHWVIADVKHGEGIVHDRNRRQWVLLPMEITGTPDLSCPEKEFQTLWKTYFEALAIAERKNLRLQRSKVPLKVRPWLVEFDENQ